MRIATNFHHSQFTFQVWLSFYNFWLTFYEGFKRKSRRILHKRLNAKKRLQTSILYTHYFQCSQRCTNIFTIISIGFCYLWNSNETQLTIVEIENFQRLKPHQVKRTLNLIQQKKNSIENFTLTGTKLYHSFKAASVVLISFRM